MTTLEIPPPVAGFFDRTSRLHVDEPVRIQVLRLDLGRWFLAGSVAAGVVRRRETDVLVARQEGAGRGGFHRGFRLFRSVRSPRPW